MEINLDDINDANVCEECGTVWKEVWHKGIKECPTCKLKAAISKHLKLEKQEIGEEVREREIY